MEKMSSIFNNLGLYTGEKKCPVCKTCFPEDLLYCPKCGMMCGEQQKVLKNRYKEIVHKNIEISDKDYIDFSNQYNYSTHSVTDVINFSKNKILLFCIESNYGSHVIERALNFEIIAESVNAKVLFGFFKDDKIFFPKTNEAYIAMWNYGSSDEEEISQYYELTEEQVKNLSQEEKVNITCNCNVHISEILDELNIDTEFENRSNDNTEIIKMVLPNGCKIDSKALGRGMDFRFFEDNFIKDKSIVHNNENDTSDFILVKDVRDEFYICKHVVTQKEFEEVVGINPSWFQLSNKKIKGVKKTLLGDDTSNHPVEQVSWFDAIYYCNKRSMEEGLTPVYKKGKNGITDVSKWVYEPCKGNNIKNLDVNYEANGYRLPTRGEWKAAATRGEDIFDNFSDLAWYDKNSEDVTHKVMQKKKNELGIYDMSGNVSEWLMEWFAEGPYCRSIPKKYRCLYRSSYHDDGSSYFKLDYDEPFLYDRTIGFRIVRSASGKNKFDINDYTWPEDKE